MEISATGAALGAPRSTQARGLGALRSEDFFKILVTEMQNQDPFEPTKTADMISQVSQIRSIELSGKLTDTLDLLTRQQRITGSSDLIGKYVQAITTAADGSQALHEGVVTGIRFNADGRAILELDTGEAVPATDVIRITALNEVEERLSEADEDDD
ncbi:MAG: flagellar hook assembly protein FlgD [Phycisphaerae bacterium]